MLDILFNPKKAERHFLEMMFVAFFYSVLSILVGVWVFPQYGSLVAVFLILISCLYNFQGVIKAETIKEEYFSEGDLLKEHFKGLKMFLFVFVGVVLAFTVFTYVLPMERSVEVFGVQNTVLEEMNGVSGKIVSVGDVFSVIFNNNLKVFFVSFVFSLIYGAGAIFILIWNGSVMGYVIGEILSSEGVLHAPLAFFRYFLHGLPEMFSYLIAILAGGIVYTAFFRGDLKKRFNTKKIVFDVLILIFLGFLLVFVSAFIEVFISSSF